MSYILDALKKSEQARQHSAPVNHYSLWPVVDEEVRHKQLWPYGIAAVLVANVMLLGYWLRPAVPAELRITAPAVSTSSSSTAPVTSAPSAPVVKEQIASIAVAASSDEARTPALPAKETEVALQRDVRIAPSPVVESTQTPKEQASERIKLSTVAKAPVQTAEAAITSAKAPPKNRQPAIPAKPRAEEPKATHAAESGKKAEPNEPARVAIATPSTQAAMQQNGKADAPAPSNVTAARTNEQASTANREELPAALQKELPALAVSGFIRDGEAEGMVIVNDRLVRAGDEVAPGVKLEKIVKDNLVFSYKGYRFTR